MDSRSMTKKLCFHVTGLQNLTSDINLLKNQPDKFVEAIEFDDHHIGFEVAEKSCGKGQLVSIEGNLFLVKDVKKFSATGKIVNHFVIGNGRMKITVAIHSFDKKIWAEFTRLLKEQQSLVDRLFRSMSDED